MAITNMTAKELLLRTPIKHIRLVSEDVVLLESIKPVDGGVEVVFFNKARGKQPERVTSFIADDDACLVIPEAVTRVVVETLSGETLEFLVGKPSDEPLSPSELEKAKCQARHITERFGVFVDSDNTEDNSTGGTMSKKTFKPGDRVLAECDIDDDALAPAVYVTFHNGYHWVLLDDPDMQWFIDYSDEDYGDDTEGLSLYPCKTVQPIPDVISDVDWEHLPRNTQILFNYLTPAWFAEYFPNRRPESVAVYVDDNTDYVPRERAVRVIYLNERKCFLPK